jgi:hypothetical protein
VTPTPWGVDGGVKINHLQIHKYNTTNCVLSENLKRELMELQHAVHAAIRIITGLTTKFVVIKLPMWSISMIPRPFIN